MLGAPGGTRGSRREFCSPLDVVLLIAHYLPSKGFLFSFFFRADIQGSLYYL